MAKSQKFVSLTGNSLADSLLGLNIPASKKVEALQVACKTIIQHTLNRSPSQCGKNGKGNREWLTALDKFTFSRGQISRMSVACIDVLRKESESIGVQIFKGATPDQTVDSVLDLCIQAIAQVQADMIEEKSKREEASVKDSAKSETSAKDSALPDGFTIAPDGILCDGVLIPWLSMQALANSQNAKAKQAKQA